MTADPVSEPALLPYGDRAVMIDVGDVSAATSWNGVIRAARLPWVVDVVPGMASVLVIGDGSVDRESMVRSLGAVVAGTAVGTGESVPAAGSVASGNLSSAAVEGVRIAVRYDGPDLPEVSKLTGLTTEQVIDAHTATAWQVAFAGFAPGFGYLIGGDSRLTVPRRPEPRPRIAAGSVGLAGVFSGVYPRASPGGWQIIGHTDEVLWDVDRKPPALLIPGVTVRFVNVEEST